MADIKLNYPSNSTVAVTISLASLGSGAQGVFTAGRESDAISNETNLDLDHILSGKIRTGTSPTASRSINVYVAAPLTMASGTPTWPDVLDGTDSAETFTSANVMNGIVKLAASMTTDNTTGRDYFFSGVSVAALFGGVLPPEYVVYVAHDSGVNLDSTGGNHHINYFRVQGQSV
jgi:hypothetical protein